MKPLLKWAGGKAKLAELICSAFGGRAEGRYLEPFIGSGAVYLHRVAVGEVADAVLGDANAKLVNFHVAVRDRVDDVLGELAAMPCDEDWRDSYGAIRDAFNDGPWHGPEHAARLLWLNRAGFNGLYRENKRGHFNVPAGSYRTVRLPDERHIRDVSAALQGAEIVTCDFRDMLGHARRGDQVYCDPPYVPLNASACFTDYCAGGFDMAAQSALATQAARAAKRGAIVVLSNHDVPIVRSELYRKVDGFEITASPAVGRAISRSASSRKAVHEVIARVGPRREVA